MSVERLELLVEEPSMEAALRALLPRVLGEIAFEVHPFQGDLRQELPNRLRGYAAWLPASWRIVVVIDRDDESCEQLKHELLRRWAAQDRSRPPGHMVPSRNRSPSFGKLLEVLTELTSSA